MAKCVQRALTFLMLPVLFGLGSGLVGYLIAFPVGAGNLQSPRSVLAQSGGSEAPNGII